MISLCWPGLEGVTRPGPTRGTNAPRWPEPRHRSRHDEARPQVGTGWPARPRERTPAFTPNRPRYAGSPRASWARPWHRRPGQAAPGTSHEAPHAPNRKRHGPRNPKNLGVARTA